MSTDPATEPFLVVEDLDVRYGDARALFGVSLSVERGQALAVLGPNGAGKSSLAAAIAGRVAPAAGSLRVDGVDITGCGAHVVSRMGIAYVPEERAIFPHLTVLEPRAARATALERALDTFPVLGERRKQRAGTLSGGEQQMLSLARVLAAPPRLLIADEMSLGLAPRLVDLVFDSLQRARAEGVTVLLVEQYVERALEFAEEAVIMRRGRLVWRGPAGQAGAELASGYLGS
jgi:branched-chain amino acid transport system ATP-binding protein